MGPGMRCPECDPDAGSDTFNAELQWGRACDARNATERRHENRGQNASMGPGMRCPECEFDALVTAYRALLQWGRACDARNAPQQHVALADLI